MIKLCKAMMAIAAMGTIVAANPAPVRAQGGMTLDQSEDFCRTVLEGLRTNPLAQPDPAAAEELLRSAQANLNRLEGMLLDLERGIDEASNAGQTPNMEMVVFFEGLAVSAEQAIAQGERILDCWSDVLDIALERQPWENPAGGTGSGVVGSTAGGDLALEEEFERVRAFSGGMQQRIEIASAVLSEPEPVILDEPTSTLGPMLFGRIEGLVVLPANDPDLGLTQAVTLDTGGGLSFEVGAHWELDRRWALELGGRVGWSGASIDGLENLGGASSPLDGDDDLLYGLAVFRVLAALSEDWQAYGEIGLGGGTRSVEVVQFGARVVDDDGGVFVAELGAGLRWALCDCGAALDGFVRYRWAEGIDATLPGGTPIAVGESEAVLFGLGLTLALN